MTSTRRAGARAVADLAAAARQRRAREAALKRFWLSAIVSGTIIGMAALATGIIAGCPPADVQGECAPTSDVINASVFAASVLAGALLLAGILTWTYVNGYSQKTARLELALADAQQRREAAGFAAQFD